MQIILVIYSGSQCLSPLLTATSAGLGAYPSTPVLRRATKVPTPEVSQPMPSPTYVDHVIHVAAPPPSQHTNKQIVCRNNNLECFALVKFQGIFTIFFDAIVFPNYFIAFGSIDFYC